ncbi:MAG TPA: MFS transporter [Rhizomicrobium sp.]|jgi:predicted MFS family arabinose efflux permease
MPSTSFDKKSGLAFVVAFGVVSLFADMAYEGMRGISGPFLATLGASGAAVGIIAGSGELAGYLLRLFSGALAQRTRAYWVITLFGYIIQMAAVPLLALAGSWWMAALLIIAERAGKAMRNPPRDVMLARAGDQIGHGWAFGLHEALDQTGAIAGPLIAALVLSLHHDYRMAFAWLGVPAALTLLSLFTLRVRFAFAGHVAPPDPTSSSDGTLPRAFWLYAAATALVGFGFADFPLIAFHFEKAHVVSQSAVPLFYAVAMGAAGAGSLVFGRWFDARGLSVLVPGIVLGIAVVPLGFFGGFWLALLGTILWGVSLGVHEAVMSAAIARMVPEESRARAYGIFTAIFGIAWFLGSAVQGVLYDISLGGLVGVSVVAEIAAFVPLTAALRQMRV